MALQFTNLVAAEIDLCEFKASLIYRGSSRTVRATWRKPGLGKENRLVVTLESEGKTGTRRTKIDYMTVS